MGKEVLEIPLPYYQRSSRDQIVLATLRFLDENSTIVSEIFTQAANARFASSHAQTITITSHQLPMLPDFKDIKKF